MTQAQDFEPWTIHGLHLFHGRVELFRPSCAATFTHHHSYILASNGAIRGKVEGAAPNASRLLLELSETSKHE